MSRKVNNVIIALMVALGLVAGSVPVSFAASPSSTMPPAAQQLVYRQGWNVYLMDMQTGARRAITTDGRGYTGIFYPWYQWSPDGKYLLLVRANGALQTAANVDLLLMQAGGAALRTLVSGVVLPDFYPSWAQDGNQIIYVSKQVIDNTGVVHNTVSSIDVAGHNTVLWRYDNRQGCGGGTPVPAEQLRWTEVGPLGVQRTMQWSMAQHLAVYSATCASGLNVTDTVMGRTQRLDPQGMAWSGGALSRQGKLAVVSRTGATGVLQVLVTTPRPGAVYRTVAAGELPAWSPDGQILYFVQRTVIGEFAFNNPQVGAYAAQVYTSAVWRARTDGSMPALMLAQDAYGLGPLTIQARDASIIYSSVDNMTALAYHLSPNHTYTAPLFQRYGPQVRIQEYVPGSGVTTLLSGAGNPAVQP
jgi:hypothetical protein